MERFAGFSCDQNETTQAVIGNVIAVALAVVLLVVFIRLAIQERHTIKKILFILLAIIVPPIVWGILKVMIVPWGC